MYLKRSLQLLLLAAALHAQLHAMPAGQQPIEIEADTMVLDERNNVSTYNGNAILIQGDMRIAADKLVVHMKDKRLHRMLMTGIPAQRASFRQTDQERGAATAYAQHIEYYPGESRLILRDEAELKQGNNHIKGPRIDYNIQTRSLIAGQSDGQPSDRKTERVRIVIEPDGSPAKTAVPK
jgi:lipopolysaccharide export system protein LptA